MGFPHEMRPDMPVTDIAFCILKNRGCAIHFKELIAEVMRVKAINQANPGKLIAQMHTEINLDSRFLHQGSGEWGLREWQLKGSKVVKIRPEPTAAAGARSRSPLRAEEDDGYDTEEDDSFAEESEEGFEGDSDEYDEDEDN